jgi:hypothetical protein
VRNLYLIGTGVKERYLLKQSSRASRDLGSVRIVELVFEQTPSLELSKDCRLLMTVFEIFDKEQTFVPAHNNKSLEAYERL